MKENNLFHLSLIDETSEGGSREKDHRNPKVGTKLLCMKKACLAAGTDPDELRRPHKHTA